MSVHRRLALPRPTRVVQFVKHQEKCYSSPIFIGFMESRQKWHNQHNRQTSRALQMRGRQKRASLKTGDLFLNQFPLSVRIHSIDWTKAR